MNKPWKCVFGFHDWFEQSRHVTLFDIVDYICVKCGAKTQQFEHPDEGQFSLDPKVKAKQKESLEEERLRAKERRGY